MLERGWDVEEEVGGGVGTPRTGTNGLKLLFSKQSLLYPHALKLALKQN